MFGTALAATDTETTAVSKKESRMTLWIKLAIGVAIAAAIFGTVYYVWVRKKK